MVTQDEERRLAPTCNLDTVKQLAAQGSVSYVGGQVQKDIDALGLDDEGVCARLRALQPSHYDHSIKYPGSNLWLDVYLIAGLYVKFKLDRKCLTVALHSFHPERDS
jgi:Motility quorum-sensing regulator, toxin of MqsA